MTRYTLIIVFVAAMLIPAQAFALGELRIGGAVLVKPGEELDPASDKDLLSGPYVGLDFQLVELYRGGLTLGMNIEGTSASNTVYQRYDTSLETLTLQAMVGYRLWITDWMSLWAGVGAGADRGIFGITNRRAVYDEEKITDKKWNWNVSGTAALTLYLPQALVESWKPWDGFNFGISLEGGYIYRPAYDFRVAEVFDNPDDSQLSVSETDMGSLDLSGGFFRIGVVWAF